MDRACSGSVVPKMIARPLGKSVSSMGSPAVERS
jgi:hypothetical protein